MTVPHSHACIYVQPVKCSAQAFIKTVSIKFLYMWFERFNAFCVNPVAYPS